jgi:hypothetical protein
MIHKLREDLEEHFILYLERLLVENDLTKEEKL